MRNRDAGAAARNVDEKDYYRLGYEDLPFVTILQLGFGFDLRSIDVKGYNKTISDRGIRLVDFRQTIH